MTESIIVTAIVFLIFGVFSVISSKAEKALDEMYQNQREPVGKKARS